MVSTEDMEAFVNSSKIKEKFTGVVNQHSDMTV